jgi:subtilisin family serine protease
VAAAPDLAIPLVRGRCATYLLSVTRPRLAGLTAAVAGALLLLPALPAAAAGTPPQETWHAEQARVPDARESGRNGQGVVVAVLDSWVDRAHKDFEGRVLTGADCAGGSCTDGAPAPDQCDHGTHVAGTVASSSFGMAPRATVLPVRVLTYEPSSGECVGRPDDVSAGIRWAVSRGARVLNLSLGPDVPGLSASSSIRAAVAEAARAGAVVVFSAGNASLPVTDSYGDSALIVAATGPNGRLAPYSQRGTGVDLAAPGGEPETSEVCTQDDCVTSLFPGNRYSVAAGTSMAAPHVAGVAALLIAQDPSRSRQDVLDRMLRTARPLADAGRGLLDARAALGAPASPAPASARASKGPKPVAPPPAPSADRPSPTAAAVQRSPVPPSPEQAPTAASLPPLPETSVSASPEGAPAPEAAPPPAAAAPLPAPQESLPAASVALATMLLLAAGTATGLSARRR